MKRARRHRFRDSLQHGGHRAAGLWWMKPMTRSAVRRRRRFSTGDYTNLADVRYERLSSISAAHIYNLTQAS